MKAKYIHPYVTFGFKRIFGEETSKPLVMDFLNTLLPPEDKIVDLTFRNAEHLEKIKHYYYYYNGVDDIYCENERVEKFMVELLIEKWDYYRERTKFYSGFHLNEQAGKTRTEETKPRRRNCCPLSRPKIYSLLFQEI